MQGWPTGDVARGSIRVRLALCLLLPVLGSVAHGQTPFFYHWGPRDGLAQYTVSVIAQDEAGYIWLGTQAGASRFNGRSFDSFTGSNGFVNRPTEAVLPLLGRVLLVSDLGGLYEVSGLRISALPAPQRAGVRSGHEGRSGRPGGLGRAAAGSEQAAGVR